MKAILQKTLGDDEWRDKLPATISSASRDLFRAMTEHDVAQRIETHQHLIDRIDQLLSASTGNRSSDGFARRSPADLIESTSVAAATKSAPHRIDRYRRGLGIVAFLLALLTVFVVMWLGDPSDSPVIKESNNWQVNGFARPRHVAGYHAILGKRRL